MAERVRHLGFVAATLAGVAVVGVWLSGTTPTAGPTSVLYDTAASAPRYSLQVIGARGGLVPSLPQSLDQSGDVAGLTGQVASTSPVSQFPYHPFDETTGYSAQLFLYTRGRFRHIRSPHLGLFPVNVVVIDENLIAGTFDDASGRPHAYYTWVGPDSVAWHPLPLPVNLRGSFGDGVYLSLGQHRLVGETGDRSCLIVWTASPHGYRSGQCQATGSGEPADTARAIDGSLDQVGATCCVGVVIWPGKSSRMYTLNASSLPRPSGGVSLGLYGYGISEASGRTPGAREVYVAGVDQVRAHVTDEVLWRLRFRSGKPTPKAMASKPTVITGVGLYRDLVVPTPTSGRAQTILPSNGGAPTALGQLSGAMGW